MKDWLSFLFFAFIVMLCRIEMRAAYSVYGSWLDDSFATLMAWPFVLAQLEMEVDVNPDGRNAGPMYFADVEELEQVLAEAADKDAPKVVGQGAEA